MLGLLAVLSSIRIQYAELIIKLGQTPIDIIPWIDITIFLWSLYAFFMVLGLSEDLLGKPISSSFREISKVFLGLNYILLVFLSLLAFYLGYLPRIPFALVLILMFVCYIAITKLRKHEEPIRLSSVWESIKSNTPQILLLIFTLCIIMTIFGNDEYLIPSFILGCVAITLYIVLNEVSTHLKNTGS